MGLRKLVTLAELVIAALVVQGAIFAAAPAKADVIYTYTGNNFTDVFTAGYTTSDKITGTLTLSSALPSSLSTLTNESALVVSYSFTDGVNTFTKPCCDSGSQTIFSFETDGSGTITNWDVILETDDNHTGDLTTLSGPTGFDQSLVDGALGGKNNADQGIWSLQSSTSSVPEPESLAIFAAALIGLGFLRICGRKAA